MSMTVYSNGMIGIQSTGAVHTISPITTRNTAVSGLNMRICCAEVDCFGAAGIAPIVTKFSLFPGISGNLVRQCGGCWTGLEVAGTVATSPQYRGGGGGPGSAGQLDTAWHSDTSVQPAAARWTHVTCTPCNTPAVTISHHYTAVKPSEEIRAAAACEWCNPPPSVPAPPRPRSCPRPLVTGAPLLRPLATGY